MLRLSTHCIVAFSYMHVVYHFRLTFGSYMNSNLLIHLNRWEWKHIYLSRMEEEDDEPNRELNRIQEWKKKNTCTSYVCEKSFVPRWSEWLLLQIYSSNERWLSAIFLLSFSVVALHPFPLFAVKIREQIVRFFVSYTFVNFNSIIHTWCMETMYGNTIYWIFISHIWNW